MSVEEWEQRHTHLKTVAKQLKRDIKAAVAQGQLPAVRYAVRSRFEWYTKELIIIATPDEREDWPSDQERQALVSMALRYQIADDPFHVMIDGGIAHHSGQYQNND